MNKDILEGKWTQLKGEAKNRWGKLTNDDLERIAGQRDKLEGRLQERYGYSRQRAEEEVDKFLASTDGKVSDLQDTVEGALEDTQGKLQDTAKSARESVASKAEDYNKQVREAAPAEVSATVEEYPWLAIVGALVVGLLIGLLLNPAKNAI